MLQMIAEPNVIECFFMITKLIHLDKISNFCPNEQKKMPVFAFITSSLKISFGTRKKHFSSKKKQILQVIHSQN